METKHTESCLKHTATRNALIAEYDRQWPNYCRNCNGAGGHGYSYDPSPAGVSLAPGVLYDFDPCPDCVERGICPRCGKTALDEDGNVCSVCGWISDDSEPRPLEWECYCWEAEASKWEDIGPDYDAGEIGSWR